MRQVWKANPCDMNLNLYKTIAEKAFPRLTRLILCGLGEPFINPNILEMLKISREKLPREAQIKISTNGSFLTPKLADKIVKEIGVDSICFSIDTVDRAKLRDIREGSEPAIILENLHHISRIKYRGGRDFKLGIEAVITTENLSDLPFLVEYAAEKDVDYIIFSHVIPYTKEVYDKTVYITMSKHSLEIIKPSLKYGWILLREASKEIFGKAYGLSRKSNCAWKIEEFWRSAEEKGCWINLPLLFSSKGKLEEIDKLGETFRQILKLADRYKIDLRLPNLYPNAKERKCPYIERSTMVVRCDGFVAPCTEYMYSHPMYVNAHLKNVYELIFGHSRMERVEDVWRKADYVNFRLVRENMARNMPWCGDCPYSPMGCYYTKTNEFDCYGNIYTCNECLYSVNLAKCNI